jgi:hypothetical protein
LQADSQAVGVGAEVAVIEEAAGTEVEVEVEAVGKLVTIHILSMTLQTSPQPPPQFTILTFFIILI